MAIQTHTATLKLFDGDWKTLGVSHLTATVVTCAQGLVEGVDFEIERTHGTVRRLHPFGRELYAFTVEYDDLSEQTAAEEQARATDYAAAKAAIANLRTYADTANPTNAATVAAVKLLCRVSIVLIKRALGVQE